MKSLEQSRARPAWSVIAGAATLQLALHAASVGRYGIFRDELYYLSCASRPAAGYVDQPAFSILFLGAWRAVFGSSAAALMIPPALCGAAVVVLTGLLARLARGGDLRRASRVARAALARDERSWLAGVAAGLGLLPYVLWNAAHGPHNSFFFWSVADVEVAKRNAPFRGPLVVIGGRKETLTPVFEMVEEAGRTGHPLAVPYENGRTIWICRDPKEPLLGVLSRDRLFI